MSAAALAVLADIAAHGSAIYPRPPLPQVHPQMVVLAGAGYYCRPQPNTGGTPENYCGPYTHLEVEAYGPLPAWAWPAWRPYADDDTNPPSNQLRTFSFVPLEVLRDYITATHTRA